MEPIEEGTPPDMQLEVEATCYAPVRGGVRACASLMHWMAVLLLAQCAAGVKCREGSAKSSVYKRRRRRSVVDTLAIRLINTSFKQL